MQYLISDMEGLAMIKGDNKIAKTSWTIATK